MNIKNKKVDIRARVTEEEKEEIQKIAEEKKTTVSALILNSIRKNITVKLDTSDYRDLNIQVKRIGNNINRVIRDYHSNGYISKQDINLLQVYLKSIDETIKNERKSITQTKEKMQKLTPKQLVSALRKQGERIPKYLLYDEVSDHIIIQLRLLIDITNETELAQGYVPFYERYIQTFHPTFFEYEELVDFSDKLDEKILEVNKIDIRNLNQLEDKFAEVLEVLNQYRKDSDK